MRSLEPAPASLCDAGGAPRYGAYRGPLPPIDLVPLAARRLDLAIKRKRWIYAAIVTDRLFVAVALVDVGYLSTQFAFVYDKHDGRMLADRSALAPPVRQRFAASLSAGDTEVWNPRGAASLRRSGDGWTLAATIGDISIEARLGLAGAPPPISVIARVPGGVVDATEKQALLPTSGSLRIAGRAMSLEGGLGGLDYTHGLLARRTAWKWAYALGQAKSGERVGLNLVEGFVGEPECAVWVDDQLFAVGEGRFTFDPKRPLDPWTVKTTCGTVDLTFSPGAMHAEHKNFGLIRSHFVQPAGVYRGSIRLPGRAPLELDGVLGVTEDQDVLW